jgi:twitching motility two-component system response regulator PilH
LARKILLADDSVTAQNMGRKILADAGYEVFTVNNGSAALKKIAEVKPDLIVLDVYMPGYSGLEVCQRLKETGETSRIPILLTVGKLEPFKPEEARRVRAEAFIVKPFEASELLSALTKLEDKMLPRSESSKPGRFARAIAAVEEGRYDKSMAVEEDAGWKNRIAFPSKKRRKTEELEDGDDPAIYNPVNKDLRTVVEHKPLAAAPLAPAAEDRLDLGALAPEGLPKDVTAEEIAALAAAAARIQEKVMETKGPEPAQEPAALVQEEDADSAQTEVQSESAPVTQHTESLSAAVRARKDSDGHTEDRKTESPAGDVAETTQPAVTLAATSDEVPSPVAAPESGDGFGLQPSAPTADAEPVTMAVSAAAEPAAQPVAAESRWIAVSVAVPTDEASLVLEEEMRKAYAALADVEAAATPVAGDGAAPVLEAPSAPVNPLSAEAVVRPAAPTEAETAPTNSADLTASAESAETAIQNFETAAAPSSLPSIEAKDEHAPSGPDASDSPSSLSEMPPSADLNKESSSAALVVEAVPEPSPISELPTPSLEENHSEETTSESAAAAPVVEEATAVAAVASDIAREPVASTENPGPESAAVPTRDTTSKDMAAGEFDIAATTAAAWASWRRIRESGDSASSPRSGHGALSSIDEAAMAVAAGAEKAPEEGPEIASIVDSVLADLRPKIVEEISKKLKKKK